MKIRYYLLEQFCVCFFKSFSNSVSKASSLAEQGHGSPPQVIFIADSSVVDGAKCPQSAPALTSGAGRVRGELGGEGCGGSFCNSGWDLQEPLELRLEQRKEGEPPVLDWLTCILTTRPGAKSFPAEFPDFISGDQEGAAGASPHGGCRCVTPPHVRTLTNVS